MNIQISHKMYTEVKMKTLNVSESKQGLIKPAQACHDIQVTNIGVTITQEILPQNR